MTKNVGVLDKSTYIDPLASCLLVFLVNSRQGVQENITPTGNRSDRNPLSINPS